MERKTNDRSVEGGVVKESTTDQNPVKVEDNGKENTGTSDEMAIVTESSKNDFSNGSGVALDNRTSFYKNNNKNFSYNARNGERKFYNKNLPCIQFYCKFKYIEGNTNRKCGGSYERRKKNV